jgi:hypothetical protein
MIQMSEMEFFDVDGVAVAPVAVFNPGGNSPGTEDETSDSSSTNSTNSTDCHHDTPWDVAQDRRGPRPGDETRLDALLGRFAGPGPLLVLCCIRLILNDFSTLALKNRPVLLMAI